MKRLVLIATIMQLAFISNAFADSYILTLKNMETNEFKSFEHSVGDKTYMLGELACDVTDLKKSYLMEVICRTKAKKGWRLIAARIMVSCKQNALNRSAVVMLDQFHKRDGAASLFKTKAFQMTFGCKT